MVHQERRQFFKRLMMMTFALVGAQTLLSACGGSGYSSGGGGTPSSGGSCETNGTTASVGSNHGHIAPTISAADVTSGTQQTYAVAQGTATHSHTVTVSAANFTTLQGDTGVNIATDSDSTGHTHTITIDCA
jgi:hypothetical protein